jgi:hypothetical protein
MADQPVIPGPDTCRPPRSRAGITTLSARPDAAFPVNKGKPGIAAKAGEFAGHGMVAARAVEPAPHQTNLQAGPAGKKDRRADATKVAGAPGPKQPNRNPRTPSHHDNKNNP